MQIVIEIDDEQVLFDIKNRGLYGENETELVILKALYNGIPLPKGHGRLIDADVLGEELHRYTEAPYKYALKVFNDAPTIIEAESEEKI